ncbi:hypothetical protein BDR26DRAFT_860402 [Obelidium mucronatum]|nr:hypothetical protein BDR26DRAFT_860402 [Obelidium mucronatum]
MDTSNNIFLAAIIIAVATTAATCLRLFTSATNASMILVAAATSHLLKPVLATAYYNTTWLDPFARYILLFLPLDIACVLLYYLLSERLMMILPKVYRKLFHLTMRAICTLYVMAAIAQVSVFTVYQTLPNKNNNGFNGNSSNNNNGEYATSVILYSLDMIIGIIIMMSTIFGISQIFKNNREAGLSMRAYKAILASDAIKFVIVLLIDLCKAIESVDPTGNTGLLQEGNPAFIHLLDSIKIALMIASLIVPNIIKEESMERSIARSVGQAKMDLEKSMEDLASGCGQQSTVESRAKSDTEIPSSSTHTGGSTAVKRARNNSIKILYSCMSGSSINGTSRESKSSNIVSIDQKQQLHRSVPSLVSSQNNLSVVSKPNLLTLSTGTNSPHCRSISHSTATSPQNRSLVGLNLRPPSAEESKDLTRHSSSSSSPRMQRRLHET